MNSDVSNRAQDWQRRTWVQLLAILIGVGPAYLPAIMSYLQGDQVLSAKEIFLYTTVLGGVMIIVMLLLLKYLCGERVRDLNLKPGRWWKDILAGIGLVVLTLGANIVLQPILASILPVGGVEAALGDFFDELVRDPLLFGLVMGPALIIGAGVFEELTRVFLLTRLWNMNSSKAWRWLAIVLSAAVFGLAHMYQGSAGVIRTGFSGLILAVYYYYSGRVAPLMISHYLHDAIQFAAIYIMANAR